MIIATLISYLILVIGTLPLAMEFGATGFVLWIIFWVIIAWPTSILMVKFAVRNEDSDD